MNERQRQNYLEAMGIQAWFPRFTLPGAKPSKTCEWDYDNDPVVASTPIVAPAPAPSSQDFASQLSAPSNSPAMVEAFAPRSSAPQSSQSILSDLGVTSAATEQSDNSAEAPPADTPLTAPQEITQVVPATPFRLAAIDVNEHTLVITDLPWTGINQITNLHERMLGNIVRALHLPVDSEWKQGVFAWPIIAEPVPVDRRYAKEAVLAYLTNQFGLKRRKTILLFGQQSAAYLWDNTQDFEHARGHHERNGVRYGVTYSLGELINVPSLKAEAWANLKPLKDTHPATAP